MCQFLLWLTPISPHDFPFQIRIHLFVLRDRGQSRWKKWLFTAELKVQTPHAKP